MAKIFIEESTLSAIGDSIRAKTGKTNMIPPLNMPTEIASIQTGGSSAPDTTPVAANDVTFYDYDGAVVASYSLEEARALTTLPGGPTHEGLIFQGWNWSLADINALTSSMNIGAMYITDDGKTRLYIHIADKARSTIPLYIRQTVANGVTIDWGDGSATETLAGTGYVNTSHTYGVDGYFTISLEVADGCTLGLGKGSYSYCVMGSTGISGKVYCNMLQKVEIGSGVTSIAEYAFSDCYSLSSVTVPEEVTSISQCVFQGCYSLSSITIPDGVTGISGNMFTDCYSLSSITIPDGVTYISQGVFQDCYSLSSITIPSRVNSIAEYAFRYCRSLPRITIPDGVTSIRDYEFRECYSLSSITIPDGVTSIGTYAFYDCCGVAEYHLKPTTPPTLSNTNAFNNAPSDCIIYVPKGCLEAYQNATKWTTYASKMQEEP